MSIPSAQKPAERTVLVVGGCGFIGSRVVRQLVSRSVPVSILDACKPLGIRAGFRAEAAEKIRRRRKSLGDVLVHSGDIRDSEVTRTVLEATCPEVVLHLANPADTQFAINHIVEFTSLMMDGTATLLEESRRCGVRRFVYVSSSMVYGDFKTDPLAETAPMNSQEPYGCLKYACERLVNTYRYLHGMETIAIRPSAVYGPGGNEHQVVARFVADAVHGRPLRVEGGDTSLDFTHVDDVARGIVFAALHRDAKHSAFNISAGQSHRVLDLAEMIVSSVKEGFVEIAERRPHSPKRGSLDIRRAREHLGFEPLIDLRSGLEDLLKSSLATDAS
ncbi:NAD-dependent epimerase/dehydratase family protein [bacterium]|nr:NAD-dependent epimerase/dehydratase family protein [bacterium]